MCMTKQQHQIDDHSFTTTRLETFSDAVIGIAATLLILEIHVPALHDPSNHDIAKALWDLAPKFIGFAVSFVTIAIFWVNHHHFMHSVKRVDRGLLWYNNFLLFWLAGIPFATAFIGDYPKQSIVVALYGFVLMMAALAFTLMIHHVFFRAQLIHDHVTRELREREYARARLGIVLYGASVLLAFVHPYISLAIFIALPLYYFLPRQIDQ